MHVFALKLCTFLGSYLQPCTRFPFFGNVATKVCMLQQPPTAMLLLLFCKIRQPPMAMLQQPPTAMLLLFCKIRQPHMAMLQQPPTAMLLLLFCKIRQPPMAMLQQPPTAMLLLLFCKISQPPMAMLLLQCVRSDTPHLNLTVLHCVICPLVKTVVAKLPAEPVITYHHTAIALRL